MPSPDERALLRLDPGVPVVSLIRTAYDAEGRPVEVFDSVGCRRQAPIRQRRGHGLPAWEPCPVVIEPSSVIWVGGQAL